MEQVAQAPRTAQMLREANARLWSFCHPGLVLYLR